MLLGMTDTPVSRVNVRLDADVAELLEEYCARTRRSKTAAINVLLADALHQDQMARWIPEGNKK